MMCEDDCDGDGSDGENSDEGDDNDSFIDK